MLIRIRRMFGSFINHITFPISIILWIFNVKPLGSLLLRTYCPDTRWTKLRFTFWSIIQTIIGLTIIGTVFVIWTWIINKPSIAQRMTEIKK